VERHGRSRRAVRRSLGDLGPAVRKRRAVDSLSGTCRRASCACNDRRPRPLDVNFKNGRTSRAIEIARPGPMERFPGKNRTHGGPRLCQCPVRSGGGSQRQRPQTNAILGVYFCLLGIGAGRGLSSRPTRSPLSGRSLPRGSRPCVIAATARRRSKSSAWRTNGAQERAWRPSLLLVGAVPADDLLGIVIFPSLLTRTRSMCSACRNLSHCASQLRAQRRPRASPSRRPECRREPVRLRLVVHLMLGWTLATSISWRPRIVLANITLGRLTLGDANGTPVSSSSSRPAAARDLALHDMVGWERTQGIRSGHRAARRSGLTPGGPAASCT